MKEIVLISGASSGIGHSTANLLAQEGYTVLAGHRKLQTKQYKFNPVLLDITKSESIEALVETYAPLLDKADRVHLINNAGIAIAGPIEAVPMKKWREQLDVNFFGMVELTQAILPWIRKTKGRIVNVGSVSGIVALPYMGPYACSKFAVEAFSDSLRREMKSFGVEVILLEPGPTETPIWEKGIQQKNEIELKGELKKIYGKRIDDFETVTKKIAASAIPVSTVSEIIAKTLRAKRPQKRILIGRKSLSLEMMALRLAPDSLSDWMIQSQYRAK